MRSAYILAVVVVVILSGCGADSRDPAIEVKEDDAEMNIAIANARDSVEDFIQRLRNPMSKDEGFSVKVMIEDGQEVEHFWLSNISYQDGCFEGSIDNHPQSVRNVKFGQKVRVKAHDITDWVYLDDGRMIGNFTLRVLLKRMPEEQANTIKEQLRIEE